MNLDARQLKNRITPACAGKTSFVTRIGRRGRDHPRMRGEDVVTVSTTAGAHGITPACAGKTFSVRVGE